MKKVVLALIALVALVSSDAFAWGRGYGYRGGRCGRSCERSCAPRCEPVCEEKCSRPFISRVEEQPCGSAPCCLTAVQVPANLVQEIKYHWECPTGCTTQGN